MKKLAIFLIAGILLSVAGATAYTDYLRSDINYEEVHNIGFNEPRTVGDRPVEVIATIHYYAEPGESSAVRVLVNGEELTRSQFGIGGLRATSFGANAKDVVTFKVPAGGTYNFDEIDLAGDVETTLWKVMETEL